MATKRHIDERAKTITIEFQNGNMFGPFELNPTTDILTKMIGELDIRVARLESQQE
jgi:hypothetical protein